MTAQDAGRTGAEATEMHRLSLHVLDGIHQGAVVALRSRNAWDIGSDVGADLLLVDDGVAARHARLDVAEDGRSARLSALADSVEVFGRPLHAGAEVSLRIGSRFTVGPVGLRLVAGQAEDGAGTTEEEAARRHVLRQLDRRAYVLTWLRPPRWIRSATLVLAAAAGVGALAWLATDAGRAEAEEHARALDFLRARFPSIEIRHSGPTGITRYTGYVDTHAQLGELRAAALAADQGRSVIQVVPMEALQWNARQILDDYYAEPEITVTGPGEIEIKLAAPAAVKNLAGWDVESVVARLRKELPELRRAQVRIAERRAEPVAVRWQDWPYSVVSTRADTFFAITESGERIFDGARSGEGVVKGIHPCGMIIDKGYGKYFVFDWRGGYAPINCDK